MPMEALFYELNQKKDFLIDASIKDDRASKTNSS